MLTRNLHPKFYFLHHALKLSLFLIPVLYIYSGSESIEAKTGGDIILKFAIYVLLIILVIKFFIYRKAVFKFEQSTLSYEVNFIFHNSTTLKYSDIKEVNLIRGPIQKFFGLGTIKVTSHATTQNAGISVYNIKNYQEIYDYLREKIK